MHPRQQLPAAATSLARAQGDVLSRVILLEMGLTPQVIRRLSADWHSLGRGLFCLRPPTWDSAAWAGVVHAGHAGVVGGLAAAHLYGWATDKPDVITIWHPHRLAPLPIGRWLVNFRQGSRRGRGELSRTNPEGGQGDRDVPPGARLGVRHQAVQAMPSDGVKDGKWVCVGSRTRTHLRGVRRSTGGDASALAEADGLAVVPQEFFVDVVPGAFQR